MTHDMGHIRAELTGILDELIAHYGFTEVVEGKATFSEWYDSLRECPSFLGVSGGSCRIVIWDQDACDYVFKIDYPNVDKREYCKEESLIYQRAVKEGVERFFAWMSDAITVYGVTFYAMEFCDVDEDELSSEVGNYCFPQACSVLGYDKEHLSDEQWEEVWNYVGDTYDSDNVMSYIESTFSFEDACLLYNFIYKYNINDLHASNWGRNENGYVIVDYAGYEIPLTFADDNVK